MKSILVLGAGLVAKPLVDYFLDRDAFLVVVADLVPERALSLVAGRPRGRAAGVDIEDDGRLASLIGSSDLVVSFVPQGHHPRVARNCVALKRHLLTASYVSAEMKALHGEAKARGLVFLNEAGLDPGLDHMEAMRIIDRVHEGGGRIVSFVSYCGGLPAPEANTNPFGYKFSWSPLGVLRASQNAARYLLDGNEILLPATELFDRPAEIVIERIGGFEGYPNRDSLMYREAYGLEGVRTILRGTLRYPGWCLALKRIREMGLLDDRPLEAPVKTCGDFARRTLGIPAGESPAEFLISRSPLPEDRRAAECLEWLGLFTDRPLPPGSRTGLEVMSGLMGDRMSYGAGERDMVVLQHRIVSVFPDGREERSVSTLVQFGTPGGATAMARTVALPAAICGRLILEGAVRERGVLIPVRPDVYRPVLDELRGFGISFEEKTDLRA